MLCLYVFAAAVAHLALMVFAPRSDQTLLPAAVVLSSLGLLSVVRLEPSFATKQLMWNISGMVGLVIALPLLSRVHQLQRYKYLAAALALGLMVVTATVGKEINGSRLWLGVGPVLFQVTEPMKVLLIVFLAGYLGERGLLLRSGGRRWRGMRMPTVPYLAPLVLVTVLAFLVLIWQRDLGATMLLAGMTLVLLYVASGRVSFVVAGVALVLIDGVVAYQLFGYIRERVDVWLDPFSRAQAGGYQISQALFAVANGSVFGAGFGAGAPEYIPAVHTDFVFAALAEELGMAGALAIIALYLLVVWRGLAIAQRQPSSFLMLLACGAATVIGLQAVVIIAGNIGMIPITGITLPFISYGGSSILANYALLALLLRMSGAVGESGGVIAAAVPEPAAVVAAGR